MKTICLTLCFFAPLILIAQPHPPNPVPLDGGLTLLLAAGGAYGFRKWKERRERE